MGVIRLGEVTNDAAFVSVEQVLEDTLEEIRSGDYDYSRALVILLDDRDGVFDVTYRNAGLSCSRGVALVEVVKAMLLAEMGYGSIPGVGDD